MPTNTPGDPTPPVQPALEGGPIITATGGHVVVTGAGFLPNHPVTIRITHAGDDIADYLTYTTDPDGRLTAPLPTTAVAETAHITATDHRPDSHGDHDLLWTNTVTVTATDPPRGALSQEVSQQNGATGAKGRYTQNAPERKINDRRFGDRRDGAHRCSIGSASAAPDTSRGSRPVWSLHAHALAAPTAKLLLRASRLALLPVDNPHVAEDLAKIKKGKQLSPILLVRGELANDVALQIADGYHRVCASYHTDENTDIPVKIVPAGD